MHRRVLARLYAASGLVRQYARDFRIEDLSIRNCTAPVALGLAIWVGFPTMAAYQDMASMVSGQETASARWNAFVEKSAAGSVHAAEMPFADGSLSTGSVSGAGLSSAALGVVALRTREAPEATPDEKRVNRADKKGRLVKVVRFAPPKAFTAGSVFDRTSSLLRPTLDTNEQLAFAVPEIKGKEIAIAAAFHVRPQEEESVNGVPAYLAELSSGSDGDVLATAYAPAAPDFSRASPFESLLRDEKPADGRFVPPRTAGEHPWMYKPLPVSVFSAKEQACLATGIYFEARGETFRGQAAVAQVILNRVRNPTYPDSICGVVYQNQTWRNRCQFSFACDGKPKPITSQKHYKVAKDIALAVTAGRIYLPEVGSSTHYHATYVNPRWAHAMEKMKKIGLHIFYRTYGGGWN